MIVGYARVSTTGQSLEVQLEKLKAVGCEQIFSEKQSGAKTDNRPELANALSTLKDGDVFIVTKIDRLARSTIDLLNILKVVSEANAGFKVLDNPEIDTTNKYGRLITGVLAVIAEFERELIRERTDEGRKVAMAKGVKFGPKPKLDNEHLYAIHERIRTGESFASIAKDYSVNRSTISRLANT